MSKELNETSKFLNFVLRHQPKSINIMIGSEGLANMNALVHLATQSSKTIDRDLIRQLADASDKKRSSISANSLNNRTQDHAASSLNMTAPETVPPEFLYHGTSPRFLASIQSKGLTPQHRQHVYLTEDEQTAMAAGQRYGKSLVIKVDALLMHQQGLKFFRGENGAWLTESVASEYCHTQLVHPLKP